MEWVTAARPRIDRRSTAWLIKRFVDPAASFLFVSSKPERPDRGTPFDMLLALMRDEVVETLAVEQGWPEDEQARMLSVVFRRTFVRRE